MVVFDKVDSASLIATKTQQNESTLEFELLNSVSFRH